MSNRNASVEVNYSLPTVLFLIFLVLKLTGTISWSWWWVTVPLWGPVAFLIVITLIVAFLD